MGIRCIRHFMTRTSLYIIEDVRNIRPETSWIARPSGEDYVKRVIAVAGDTVNIQDGKVYVNGEEVRYDGEIGTTEKKSSKITYPLRVGDKEVFVLGDNREVSRDSREIGTVKVSDIEGKIEWYMGRP